MKSLDRPPTLAHAASDAIREAVFKGRFQPGEPLTEVSLSESLGVSRGTVRGALRQLQREGLVEIVPHRGAFVRQLTPRVAEEVYSLRSVLEPLAVRLALERGGYRRSTLDALETLTELLTELEEKLGESDVPLFDMIEADVAFHHLICRESDHQLLLELLEQLESLTWLSILHTEIYRAYVTEPSHLDILEALRSGDPDRAVGVLTEHIRRAGDELLRQMRHSPPHQSERPVQA
jgi:DNA-binding GntR family transcriptional regulator